jgi:dolichol-phosphate mannosyltransferase
LGRAYLAGIAESLDRADALITMDADFSHDPAHLPALIEAGKSHDLVIGSRYTKGGGVAEWEPWRRALSLGGNLYTRAVTGMPVSDATSGFQLVHTQALRGLNLANVSASGYAFQIELKFRLWSNGATLAEVPIVFQARRGGESKLTSHIVREGVLTPWRLRFFPKDRRLQ